MSFVGPRSRKAEVADLNATVSAPIKAGLTGLWLVVGRELSDSEATRLDSRYIANWSLMLDLMIIWKTYSRAIKGDGGQYPYASE